MARISRLEPSPSMAVAKKRVAAYARVSMECENLMHSLSAQVSYYSGLIQNNPEWIYAGVFADNGITGTSTKQRDEFNRMMAECEAGNIDIILVKSVSRFARNTVDTLKATRRLKSLGVEVRFEREGISSLTADGELMLTILASYAQEESESISRNGKWAIKKKFEQGIPTTSLRSFGYDWDGENKALIINEEEAEWVRYIYREYLNGKSIKGLAADLHDKGVAALRGEPLGRSTIRRILTSRMYVGDIILQQYYTEGPHNVRRNRGEVPQYEVVGNHEGIISRDVFDAVQRRVKERARNADNYGYAPGEFAGLVRCGKCGYACNHVKDSRDSEEKARLECNKRKTKECDLLPIKNEELKSVMNGLLGKRDKLTGITLYDDHIDFHLQGGSTKKHQRIFPKGGYYKTCFSHRTFCGECGASAVRMRSGKRKCWTCNRRKEDKDACQNVILSEEELTKAARWAVRTDENFEMEYYCTVEKAVIYRDRITFIMRNGGEKIWQRR